MELGAKGSLRDLIDHHRTNGLDPLPERTIWKIFVQVLMATHQLHSHDIIHCDIKSTNVLFKDNDKVLLCDFNSSQKTNNQGGLNLRTTMYYSR